MSHASTFDAASKGDVDALRMLGKRMLGKSLLAKNHNGSTPAHAAAQNGHVECLRALHELGAAGSLLAKNNYGATPAHLATQNGHVQCLRALHELGAAGSLLAKNNYGAMPAHAAARNGHADCLRALHQLGAAESLAAKDDISVTPAHAAAHNGHVDCLRVLHELGAAVSLSAKDDTGATSAHAASRNGHVECLRALHELGAAESLSAKDDTGATSAHAAARNGHVECLRALHELLGKALDPQLAFLRIIDAVAGSLSAKDDTGATSAHAAAENGHVDCLRALHELGAAESLSAKDNNGATPAHTAALKGHADCLRALHELGAVESLSATGNTGRAPMHLAAMKGHVDCLRALHELGAAESVSAKDNYGFTPAHAAALNGHADCLRALHELGAVGSLSAKNNYRMTPAHAAADSGHADCLRALHELGAAESLSAKDNDGQTPAHTAAVKGHVDCLRALHELGAAGSLSAKENDGQAPAHTAALNGHADCLRVLHELGAARSLSATDNDGFTPAHSAAENGHANCLRALHELLSKTLDPQLAFLRTIDAVAVPEVIRELQAKRSLSWSPNADKPAEVAANNDHIECFLFLSEIGGATPFWEWVAANPELIEQTYPWLLAKPQLLNLQCKRAWLRHRLDAVVRDAGSGDSLLSLVAPRDNILDGLCAQLGVDEATGTIVGGTTAVGLDVRFRDEAGDGDGLRREWFGLALAEMLDPNRGLFVIKEGSRALEPNPESATTAGPDHLSYFALLGRITGLAIYHRETLNASWTQTFLKVAFGYKITHDDLSAECPELYRNQRMLIDPEKSAEDREAAMYGLTFVVDSDEAIVYAAGSKRRRSTELKPGGEDIEVAPGNVHEYLQLYAEHLLVSAIQPQVAAFRDGLRVFISDELCTTIRACCTVAEVQLMLCGVEEIDVDDWEHSAKYEPAEYAVSPRARWLWEAVREMAPEERSKLLFFCTGSSKPPATGFGELMGYRGQQQRFTVARVHGADTGQLPTASTCFNTLHLPEYASLATLCSKLQQAIAGAQGFDEAAVAH